MLLYLDGLEKLLAAAMLGVLIVTIYALIRER